MAATADLPIGWLFEATDIAAAARILGGMPVARLRAVEIWPVSYGDASGAAA